MKHAGMTGAIALAGIGMITIGLSSFVKWAEAAPSISTVPGPATPMIIAFGSLGGAAVNGWQTGFYRLWSDSTLEIRLIEFTRTDIAACENGPIQPNLECDGLADTGWFMLSEPPGGNGFACRSDINGDRTIDAEDIGLLLAGWGRDIDCDPHPSYPCFDLNGLRMNATTR